MMFPRPDDSWGMGTQCSDVDTNRAGDDDGDTRNDGQSCDCGDALQPQVYFHDVKFYLGSSVLHLHLQLEILSWRFNIALTFATEDFVLAVQHWAYIHSWIGKPWSSLKRSSL